MQLCGLACANHRGDQRPRLVELPQFQECEREVVAARVAGRIDRARALQVRQRLLQFAPLQIERCELILRLETVGSAAHRLRQALLDGCRNGSRRARRGFRRLCDGSRSYNRDQHEREEKPDPAIASYQYSLAPS